MQEIEESSKSSSVESRIHLEEGAQFLQEIRFEEGDQIDMNIFFRSSRNVMDHGRSTRNEHLDLRLGNPALDGGRVEATMHNVEDDDNFFPMSSLSRDGKGISRCRQLIPGPATNEPDLELRVGIGRLGAGFSLGVGIGGPFTRLEHQRAPSNSTSNVPDYAEEDLCQTCKRRKLEPTSGQSDNMSAHVQSNRSLVTCPICLDSVKEESSTICGHIFCRSCILSAIQTTKKCPTCRKRLTANGFHRIFLPSSDE